MNNLECTFEREVTHAEKTDAWNERLQNHLQECSSCRNALLIAKAMDSVQAGALQKASAVPAYRVLWFKAQYMQRQERLSTLDLVKLLGVSFVGALALIGIIVWKIPTLSSLLTISESASGFVFHTIIPLSIPIAFIIAVVIALWMYSLEFFFARR
ncbi:MAG: hypothetical protein EPO24_06340 [Bacteroidetes bacterium]|nr:MAG: hypothetical protein EPO24_06340 [Bacteroidota bacterium]